MKFIVIALPRNPKSAGSMVLYELADEIRNLGFEAARVLIAQNKDGHFFVSIDEKNFLPLTTDTLERYFDPENDVIIHGENLHHKFFDKFNVARYYLNKIGALRNIGVPKDGEYKIAWQTSYVEAPDFVLRRPVIKTPINEALKLDQPRLVDVTYIGKGILYEPNLRRLPGTIELTRSWPDDIDEYLLLLSKTRFLFTYDVQTSVVEEAIMYGAQPVLMTHMPMNNMKEVRSAHPYELSECYLSSEEFSKLTDKNIDQNFSHFCLKRKQFISYLEMQKSDYNEKLKVLLGSIQERFNPLAFNPEKYMNAVSSISLKI